MRTWALDVLVLLLASAPLLTVPVSVGLLFFTAAMYLSFKTLATMWRVHSSHHMLAPRMLNYIGMLLPWLLGANAYHLGMPFFAVPAGNTISPIVWLLSRT